MRFTAWRHASTRHSMKRNTIIYPSVKRIDERHSLTLRDYAAAQRDDIMPKHVVAIRLTNHWGFIVVQQIMRHHDDFDFEIWGLDSNVEDEYDFEFSGIKFRMFPDSGDQKQLVGALLSHPPSIVHMHAAGSDLHAANHIFRSIHNMHKIVQTFHSSLVEGGDYSQRGFEYTDALFFCNCDPALRIGDVYGCSTTQVTVGVDFDTFVPGDKQEARKRLGIPKDAFVLISTSRLIKGKRLRLVIDALREVESGEWLYGILGMGPEEQDLKEAASFVSHPENIRFCGHVPRVGQVLIDYLNAADVLVHPSEVEGGPLAIIEAIACECPVLCTDTGTVASFLRRNDAGIVVPVDQENAFKKALIECIETRTVPGLADRDAARLLFDEEYTSRKIHRVYRDLLR